MRSDNSIFGLLRGAGLLSDSALSALVSPYLAQLRGMQNRGQQNPCGSLAELAALLRLAAAILRMNSLSDALDDPYRMNPMASDILRDIMGMVDAMSALGDGFSGDRNDLNAASAMIDRVLRTSL